MVFWSGRRVPSRRRTPFPELTARRRLRYHGEFTTGLPAASAPKVNPPGICEIFQSRVVSCAWLILPAPFGKRLGIGKYRLFISRGDVIGHAVDISLK